ncbi:MAG: transaldolase [Candidatus Dadabacteria bacterium]|nr:MAG: transaldolase [Candidatus Dadabacteria bacterium]
MAKNPTIEALNQLGQSIWYDNLSRDVLNSGELKKIIDAGVSGLTSNPTIFKKAIADSADYDDRLKELASSGLNTEEICEELMIEDVGQAADLLRPVYEESNGADGFTSIEVSPFLADKTAQTVEAAKRLWSKLKRPNIMIKVPATPEGIPAIEELLYEGINVNVTLIFSVDVYAAVVDAYLKGLERRKKEDKAIDKISSVASFFVSRVDAICEKYFDTLVEQGKTTAQQRESFLGKVGVANSKLAYNYFEKEFSGQRFSELGSVAGVQRPLWASTGTKNPDFRKTLYVEELAGKNTVNTVPPVTLNALMQGIEVSARLHQGLDQAKEIIATVKELGIPFEDLLLELQIKGVKAFADSYRDLLESLESKQKSLG